MKAKKKICAGFDGNEHEAYIYKNINGAKYCKSCALKLLPPKELRKVSKKQVFKIKIKKELLEEDKKFYLKVWEDRTWKDDPPGMLGDEYPRCECCRKSLGSEPNMMYFHHILEKRNYPELRHVDWNIMILCPECHNAYETNPLSRPNILNRRETTWSLYKNEYLK